MDASGVDRHQRDVEPGAKPISVVATSSGAGVVLGVLVALLILFYWLHFLVAHENESIGRKIQAQTEELARIERVNMALRQQVATTYAEAVMAERARALGYRPQQPLYLLVDRPLAPASAGSHSDRLFQPSIFRDAPVMESTAETGANVVPGTGAERSSAVAGRP